MDREGQLLPRALDDEAATVLADARNRRVLATLLPRSQPLTTRDLGILLGSDLSGVPPATVSDDVLERIWTDLHHRCLPALDDAGLIERYPAGVLATDAVAEWFAGGERPAHREGDEQFWGAIAALCSRPRRRDVVAVVAGYRRPVTVEELATRLEPPAKASRPTAGAAGDVPSSSELHHIDLPRLAAVGLIEYDRAENVVTSTPALSRLLERTGISERTPPGLDAD